jgi:hypothetical protein
LALEMVVRALEQGHAREDLVGRLESIRLPALLALFEMERMSGVLTLHRGTSTARLYVDDGRVLDVEPVSANETPRAALGRFLTWTAGAFVFAACSVTRVDRVGTSITGLLLDLAHATDEARRASCG